MSSRPCRRCSRKPLTGPWLHDLGSDVAGGSADLHARASWAAPCWRWARADRGTMAVTFVIGNCASTSMQSLFAPGTTTSPPPSPTSSAERPPNIYKASVIELGLILFFITFVVLAGAQLMPADALERRAGVHVMNRSLVRSRKIRTRRHSWRYRGVRRRCSASVMARADSGRSSVIKASTASIIKLFTAMMTPPPASEGGLAQRRLRRCR